MLSIVLGIALLVAGTGYVVRRLLRRGGPSTAPLDDSAVREIERTGRLAGRDPADDAPLDAAEIEAAEEEFWKSEWDEPEEYER